MVKKFLYRALAFMLALTLCSGTLVAQTPASGSAEDGAPSMLTNLLAQSRARKPKGFALMPGYRFAPMAANEPVIGGGTVGRLTKWTGFTSSNSFIGDSNIFENKFGLIGIGTSSPTSLLTVAGVIESSFGGVRFPDGTVQTTAGAAPGDVVRSLNGLKGDLTLAEGSNIGISAAGNTLTVGVKVPFVLSGSVPFDGVIQVTNNVPGSAIVANGASLDSGDFGGVGVSAFGGRNLNGGGGIGISAAGGGSENGFGGIGVIASGGLGSGVGNRGGHGIFAISGPGLDGATNGLAGRFSGDVQVSGTLSKGGGSFRIDHPLDPENKYLYHSFVESPDMKNIYDGNIMTDSDGEAVVELPHWFEALNHDFRYQLTVMGKFAQAIVAEKIKGNRFTIRTSAPNIEVSWQVTGIRRDAFANKNRIPVEEDKPEVERGYYLHPEAFDQPEEKSILWARDPERMRQLKQRRVEAEQMRNKQKAGQR